MQHAASYWQRWWHKRRHRERISRTCSLSTSGRQQASSFCSLEDRSSYQGVDRVDEGDDPSFGDWEVVLSCLDEALMSVAQLEYMTKHLATRPEVQCILLSRRAVHRKPFGPRR